MIAWLILFLLVVAISFLLAFQSMKDYQEVPQKGKVEYGLFLIRQPHLLNSKILELLHPQMLKDNFIISLERLFKGGESALTIFGPKQLLNNISHLDLVELEDYATKDNKDFSVWEVGVKPSSKLPTRFNNIFSNLPNLRVEDQMWWQVILGAKKEKGRFQTQIRVAASPKNLSTLSLGELVKVPKPFSNEQLLNFYQLRSLGKDSKGPLVDAEGAISLVRI